QCRNCPAAADSQGATDAASGDEDRSSAGGRIANTRAARADALYARDPVGPGNYARAMGLFAGAAAARRPGAGCSPQGGISGRAADGAAGLAEVVRLLEFSPRSQHDADDGDLFS